MGTLEVEGKTMRSLVLASVLLVGCGSPPPDQAETDKVVSHVWVDLLQASWPPPMVQWVAGGGPCLDAVHGVCADGMYDGTVALVEWKGTNIPPTALAHELLHAWFLETTGDGDAKHENGGWYREERINYLLGLDGY